MRTAKLTWTVVALALAAGVLPGCRKSPKYKGPPITLKLRYPSGSYLMTMVQDTKQRISAERRKQTQIQTQTMVMGLKIAEPDASGDRNATLTFRRIRMSGPGGMSYDSDNSAGADPQLAQVLGAMMKVEITMKIGPDSRIRDVSGFEKMWDAIPADNPVTRAMREQFKKQLGDAMVRELMEKTQDMFPARAVKPRDEWQATVSANVPIVGKLRIKYDLELEDVEQTPSGKIAIINFKGKVDSAGGGTIAMGPVSVRIKSMDMDQEGVMRFNTDTGMMVSQKIEQNGAIEMSIKAGGKSIDATTDIEQTINMAVKKEKPASRRRG